MNIMICSSDNCATSGAFLCMLEMCRYIQNKTNLLVILPCEGSGSNLLQKYNIPYKIIRSYPWVTPINGGAIKKIKSYIKAIVNYKAVKEITRIIKKYDIDIVHSNSTWSYVGIAAAKKCGVRCVWHLREAMELSQGLRIFYSKDYIRSLIQYTNTFIAVSSFIKEYFKKEKNITNIITIYDTVDAKKYYNSRKRIFQNESVNIIMVNAVYPGKRQLELMEALTYIKPSLLNYLNVYVVGDTNNNPSYFKELKRFIIDNNLSSYVRFMGTVQEIEKIYLMGDISCICSPFESFGRVTIESMLSGCLVIGCDSGATKELIKDGVTGLHYRAGDAKSLANKIEHILSHKKDFIMMSKEAQRYALSHFQIEKTGEQIFDLYKRIYSG
ncbi:glycosyltransferase family 4 protein [uncultured Veillonella sp.]|uniref:glycosyltransferase family 4 protein n=1 Tax=uncultured Veillonella sp. TaxID=159268 RepID=UPI00259452D9|nr:glycosyltransferase family 4 protein [uncultured Veillonella sp.]